MFSSAQNSMHLSQSLENKIDPIVQAWIEAVCQNDEIEPTKKLTYKGIRNSIPNLLQALVTLLSSEADDVGLLVDKSLEHGILRAKQGYDPEEVAREYRILRQVLFSHLETDLLAGSSQEVLQTVRLIDAAIDGAIATCFKSYTKKRLEDLETLYEQLALTNQELTRLVEAHQDNLSKLAHELKNPLTSIIGYSDLFLRQQRQQTVKEGSGNLKHIEQVLRNGRQLLHLINDALEISRYKAGKMQLKPTPTDVCAVIDSVIEVLQPLAQRKELPLSINCAHDLKPVVTDTLRLQQVLINLISNAIRYTESGEIKVICQMLTNQQLAITISDTGVGIAPTDQAKIFAPFYRAIQNGHYNPDSTGLGLTIVSQLVELLQGEIQLVSHVGKGSAFTVVLPLRLEAERAKLNGSNA